MEHHHHTPPVTDLNKAFLFGIVINAAYVLIEFSAGIFYHSISLISDAGHNLSDVAALALALLAFRLVKVEANDKFTYGYRKSTILVSLTNSVILFVAIGGIVWETISRFQHPVILQGKAIAIIAGLGILINSASAMLFFRAKDKDLNVKGAYLHLMADAAVSMGVVVSGILMELFQLYWLDMAMSMLIVVVIFYSTWNLFKDSLSLTLDGVPKGVDLNQVVAEMKTVEGVLDVHHLHVWAISTSQNALTAHVMIHSDGGISQLNRLKRELKHELEHVNIHHVTLEFETEDENCIDDNTF